MDERVSAGKQFLSAQPLAVQQQFIGAFAKG
jgi:hypothetical protein